MLMQMKNIAIALLAGSLMATSCNKFLDVTPRDLILEDQVFSSEAGINNALNGVYLGMTTDGLYGGNLTLSAVEAMAQRYDLSRPEHAIITQHADIQVAVNECILGALSYNGQRCTAIKILFVHRSIATEFNARLGEAIGKMKFGMPWEKGVQLTPVAEPGKPAYIREVLDDAIAHGAAVVNENGGATNESFVFPAVVYPVNDKMKLYREEQFGPVIPVVPYDEIEETIDYLIESPHGQQVSVFSNNPDEVASLIDPLVNQVSRVNLNSQCQRGPDVFPFTGRKDSAEGTLSVHDALRSFSIRSLVATKMNDTNKKLLEDIVNERSSDFLSTNFIF
jgi:glyceraldehyde-3-phosphate dehydrogenase (NADP+)